MELAPFQARGQNAQLVLLSALITQINSNIVITERWAKDHEITDESSLKDRLAVLKGITMGVSGVGSGSDHINPDRDLNIVGLSGDRSPIIVRVARR